MPKLDNSSQNCRTWKKGETVSYVQVVQGFPVGRKIKMCVKYENKLLLYQEDNEEQNQIDFLFI